MFNLSDEDKKWISDVWEKTEKKISSVVDRTGEKIPYTTKDGVFDDRGEKQISWWTNGFWPGLMLIMYEATGNEKYLQISRRCMDRMDKAFENCTELHHDVGFMWNISSGADYRLTGDKKQRNRFLIAANILAGRYNPNGKFIRAWNISRDFAGLVIIDCMMNLPLLYRASEDLDDNRFADIAMNHANTTMKYHVRADGSVHHQVRYDLNDGTFLSSHTGQGYGGYPLSSWSRGQAWALYGFVLSYKYTKNEEYLNTAKNIAHYFISNIAQTNWLSLCDFRSPKAPLVYDSTAGVCAACGLIELAKNVDEIEKHLYLNAAISILKATESKFCDFSENEDSIVQMGTEEYGKGEHMPIIYGDFFFVEALNKLMGRGDFVW